MAENEAADNGAAETLTRVIGNLGQIRSLMATIVEDLELLTKKDEVVRVAKSLVSLGGELTAAGVRLAMWSGDDDDRDRV
jgi:hypothetical protein